METTKTIYETGATSHAVNDLILFADNTRELAETRDMIFKNNQTMSELRPFVFSLFLTDCMRAYKKEFPTNCNHILNMSIEQQYEFKELYSKDFTNWKQEHGVK